MATVGVATVVIGVVSGWVVVPGWVVVSVVTLGADRCFIPPFALPTPLAPLMNAVAWQVFGNNEPIGVGA